mgnify:CR=1 FL=1
MISFIGLVASGLNNIFHWIAQFLIFNRSCSSSLAVSVGVLTVEKIAVSSANNLTLQCSPSGKSFMNKINCKSGTPDFIGSQGDD